VLLIFTFGCQINANEPSTFIFSTFRKSEKNKKESWDWISQLHSTGQELYLEGMRNLCFFLLLPLSLTLTLPNGNKRKSPSFEQAVPIEFWES
jgi:hypothetical protein